MALRHLAVAGGVALLSAHLFRSMRSPSAQALNSRDAATPGANARTDDLLDQGEGDNQASEASTTGTGASTSSNSSALEGANQLSALKQQERPELGLPSDTSNDADRARPGLGDFARGA